MGAVIRDQITMGERSLLKWLESISPKKWYEYLNGKVFLWATLHRLEGLLNARAYRGKEHVDARGLLSRYASTMRPRPRNFQMGKWYVPTSVQPRRWRNNADNT